MWEKAKEIIKHSEFTVDEETEEVLRCSGRTGAGEDPSPEIIRQAKCLVPKLREAGYRVSVEVIDEWICLDLKGS